MESLRWFGGCCFSCLHATVDWLGICTAKLPWLFQSGNIVLQFNSLSFCGNALRKWKAYWPLCTVVRIRASLCWTSALKCTFLPNKRHSKSETLLPWSPLSTLLDFCDPSRTLSFESISAEFMIPYDSFQMLWASATTPYTIPTPMIHDMNKRQLFQWNLRTLWCVSYYEAPRIALTYVYSLPDCLIST